MRKIAAILVFGAGVLWGSMGIFVRLFENAGLGTMEIVEVRAITTTLIMFLFLFAYDRRLLIIKWKDLWCFLGTGIASIVFFNFCYFKAITMTSLSVAAVLLYTAPAFVILFSHILFGESLTARKVLALILTFVGCVLVTGMLEHTGSVSTGGILLGLGAGLGYAMYTIFSRCALKKGYHSFTISFYTFLVAAIGAIPMADLRMTLKVSGGSAVMIGYSFMFGFITTVLAFIMYTTGMSMMDSGKAAIIASVEPVVATIIGVVLYHESLTLCQWIGVVLVFGAIVMCSTEKNHFQIDRKCGILNLLSGNTKGKDEL